MTTQVKLTYLNIVNKNELIDWLTERINYYIKEKVPVNQMAVLTVKTLKNSILQDVSQLSGFRSIYDKNDSGILFTTSRKLKGLEADVVF